jgi:hypothetical protein
LVASASTEQVTMWKHSEVKRVIAKKVWHAAPYQATGPTPTLYSLITHFTIFPHSHLLC